MKMRITLLALAFLLAAGVAEAQDQKTADKKFWFVSAALVGSTIYDVESTYYVFDKCPTCRELNPTFMKHIVYAGRPALYAVQGSMDAGIIFMSYKFKQDPKLRWMHKSWWVLPVAVSVAHSLAGTHNIRFALTF